MTAQSLTSYANEFIVSAHFTQILSLQAKKFTAKRLSRFENKVNSVYVKLEKEMTTK